MRILLIGAFLGTLISAPAPADGPSRWLPEHCLDLGSTSESWNEAYGRGFRAIEAGDYGLAESEMCRALDLAREFEARDWRFAETLDELGLIAFELEDYDLAEAMQGAAIAEMLLAAGPKGEPLAGVGDSESSAIRKDCRSGVAVYIKRLGWIHDRGRGRMTADELRSAPWSVFRAGYVPLSGEQVGRLDWLISQYLLQENLAAAEELTGLQQELSR